MYKSSQWTYDVYTTSNQRRCNVLMSPIHIVKTVNLKTFFVLQNEKSVTFFILCDCSGLSGYSWLSIVLPPHSLIYTFAYYNKVLDSAFRNVLYVHCKKSTHHAPV